MSRFWKIALAVIVVVVIAGIFIVPRLGGHGGANGQAGKANGDGQGTDQPPVPVTVVPVVAQDVPVYLTATGTAQARNSVVVRPQVGGQLMKLNFQEGQEVKAGDVIAEIDPRTIQSQYDQAVAKLRQDQAAVATAKNNLERSQNLVSKGGQQYVSKQDLDNLKNTLDQANAAVAADQGSIRASQVQLGFTKVIAPITGLAGIRAVDVGNIVATGDTIVTLTEVHPIYVTFNLPEKNLDLVRTSIREQGDTPLLVDALDRIDAHVVSTGHLDVIDNTIDTTTGTFRLRALFDNQNTELWPGQFVNARLKVRTVKNGLVVPAQAVQRGPDGDYVYLVQGDNTVKMQPVETATEVGDSHVLIGKGLKLGEKVVTEGQFRLKPGSKVQPLAPGQVPAAPTAEELQKAKQGQQGKGGRRGG
ncbi:MULTISPECIES: efflux RND transporter periplasmic adaptor subunit [Luteibacter]|uniref:Efflux RND transporter periplasmic adaptor subunit n=1 Tax=Luteibacter flocculans TaxID=2780091 RepID=A0ABY4T1I3_9GAMM|nr:MULTISPECIES: efflux RND transporter periplasmic adaptor subunit [Luteibacter]URL58814.1 efflux RND transporter periplasmic adaptor subunit [Luteibacter flocculans]SFW75464.1 membrane fusion protein, multidrug efflux system [Luteibacter sp. UNCMF366Tsu5.1]